MNASTNIGSQIRDHLFVLAWVVAAVVVKYSVSLPERSPEQPQPAEAAVANLAPAAGSLAGDR